MFEQNTNLGYDFNNLCFLITIPYSFLRKHRNQHSFQSELKSDLKCINYFFLGIFVLTIFSILMKFLVQYLHTFFKTTTGVFKF